MLLTDQVKWFSPFLMAVYDRTTESYQSLCRCMSGFTDEFYEAATKRLGALALPGPKPYYVTGEILEELGAFLLC
jgi:DNA ligase-1